LSSITHHATETYRGVEDMVPRILKFCTRWTCMVSFTLWPLYPRGIRSKYRLYRRLGGPQNRSERCEKNIFLPMPGSNPDSLAVQPVGVGMPTELSRLLLLSINYIIIIINETASLSISSHRVGWHSGNALELYSEGSRFESRPGHQMC
jgi:hypothetical protein